MQGSGRQRGAAIDHCGKRVDHDSVDGRESVSGRLECLPLVVDLGAIVEHDQPRRRGGDQHQLDRLVEILDPDREHPRSGFVQDGPQVGERRAGLQRHGHRTERQARQIHGDVITAGEPEQRHDVARPDGLARVAVPFRGHRARPRPQLCVAGRVEFRAQAQRATAGHRIGHDLGRSVTESGPVGIPGHDRFHQVRERLLGTVADLGV